MRSPGRQLSPSLPPSSSFAFPDSGCRAPGPASPGRPHAPAPRSGYPVTPTAPPSVASPSSPVRRQRFPGWPGLPRVAPPRPSSAPGRRSLIGRPPTSPGLLSSPSPNGHPHLVQKFPRGDRGGSATSSSRPAAVTAPASRRAGSGHGVGSGEGRRRRSKGVGEKTSERNRKPAGEAAAAAASLGARAALFAGCPQLRLGPCLASPARTHG